MYKVWHSELNLAFLQPNLNSDHLEDFWSHVQKKHVYIAGIWS